MQRLLVALTRSPNSPQETSDTWIQASPPRSRGSAYDVRAWQPRSSLIHNLMHSTAIQPEALKQHQALTAGSAVMTVLATTTLNPRSLMRSVGHRVKWIKQRSFACCCPEQRGGCERTTRNCQRRALGPGCAHPGRQSMKSYEATTILRLLRKSSSPRRLTK